MRTNEDGNVILTRRILNMMHILQQPYGAFAYTFILSIFFWSIVCLVGYVWWSKKSKHAFDMHLRTVILWGLPGFTCTLLIMTAIGVASDGWEWLQRSWLAALCASFLFFLALWLWSGKMSKRGEPEELF